MMPPSATRRLLVLGIVLAGCPGGNTDSVVDTDSETDDQVVVDMPELRFAEPEPDTTDDLQLLIDNEDPAATYTISWKLGAQARAEFVGLRTIPADATMRGDVWTATVSAARDGVEPQSATLSVTIVDAPPVIQVAITPDAPTPSTDLTVTVTPADPDGDEITSTFAWAKDGELQDTLTTGMLSASYVRKGERWTVTVTPNDGQLDGEPVTDEVTIGNSPPLVTSATIFPGTPDTHTDVTAVLTTDDPDGDTGLVPEITWYVDAVVVTPPSPTTLPSTMFENHQQIYFEARVSDGTSWSPVVRSSTITVRNNVPSSGGVHVEPAVGANATTTLSCVGTDFLDLDDDPEGWRYTWTVGGELIPGPYTSTLTSASFARGDRVSCTAAPWDGFDAGPALISATITIGNALPSTGHVTVTPSPLTVGTPAVVTFDKPADPDGDAVSYHVRWRVDDVVVSEGDGLLSLTSGFSVGAHVTAEIIPRDSFGPGVAVTSAPVVVGNAKPQIVEVALTPDVAYTNTDLVAHVTAIEPDGQAMWNDYTWFVDNQVVRSNRLPYGEDDTLPSSFYTKGQDVMVTVTSRDGLTPTAQRSTPFTAGPRRIANALPSYASATLDPSAAQESTVLTCVAAGASDVDGDTVTPTYRWTVAGRLLAGITGSTITGVSFRKGDQVSCSVTPSDGTASGTAVVSTPVTIGNAAPTLASATLSNAAPKVNDPPIEVVLVGASDPDGDTLSFGYKWFVDGVQKGTGSTLSPALARPGQAITCQITPFDGTAYGPTVSTPSVTAEDTAPDIVSVVLSPPFAGTTDAIHATVSASDPDGDVLALSYVWMVDGVTIVEATTATLPALTARRGQIVRVSVRADDGFGGTDELISAPLQVANSRPSITGVHVDPAVLFEDSVASCVPDGPSDADGDTLTYVVEWYSNGTRVSLQPTLDGSKFKHGDNVSCAAKPIDLDPANPGDQVTSASVTVANTPPTLVDATLSDLLPTEASAISVVAGTRADLDVDPISFQVRWLVDGVQVSTDDVLTGDDFAKGQHVQAFVAPYDGFDLGAEVATPEVVVLNATPTIVAIDLSPGAPTVADAITATVQADDLDDDVLTLTYQWIVDGNVAQDGPSATLPTSAFHQGSAIRVVVTAADDEVSSAPSTSSTVIVGNSPPSITGVVVTPTAATEKTTLTCSATGWSDADGDTPGYQIRWYVNGALKVGTATITGTSFARGDSLVCKVRPYDGKSFGTEVSSTPVVVDNSAPSVTSAHLSTATPHELDQISVVLTGLVDADGDVITKTWAWFVDDVQVATTATLSGSSFDKGQRVHAVVTLTDGVATVPYTTEEVVVVDTAPSVFTVTLAPGVPRATDDLTATVAASDPDPGDVVTLSYAWTVAGELLANPTGNVLPAGNAHKHQDVTVTVTATDGTLTGTPKTSATVTVVNSLPTITSVAITPTTIDERTTPTCVATGATDADGDPVTLTYRWTRAELTIGAADVLEPERFRRGDHLRCAVSGFDQEGFGAEVVSSEVIVGNAPPTVELVQINPPNPRIVDVVAVQVVLGDLDGDVPTWRQTWFVNGAQVSTQPQIDQNLFDRGDTIEVEVVPNDGFVDGAARRSLPVVIGNTAPSISRVLLTPTEFRTNDVVGATVTSADADGDPITYTYTWYVDGAVVQSGATSTLNGAVYFSKGQTVSVEVTAHDPVVDGETRASTTLTVLNSAPTSPVIALSPESPEPWYDDITCSLATPSVDADGDAIIYEFQWIDGVGAVYPTTVGPQTTSVFLKTNTRQDMELLCSARASDGAVWSLSSPQEQVHVELFVRQSCRDWRTRGATTDGVYELDLDGHGGPAAPIFVDCDMTTEGGGWTKIVRTTSNNQDFGQNTHDIVTSFVGRTAASGVFESFGFVDDYARILIKQVSGAQAGKYRMFTFGPSNGNTVLGVLQHCRDDVMNTTNSNAWAGSAAVRHTSVYTGLGAGAGDLAIYRDDGSSVVAPYFFACGVSNSDDKDVSYLAFADLPGNSNDWGDNWRGVTQVGTIWSFANGDYYDTVNCSHIGGGKLQAFAGWKGTAGSTSGIKHQGTYEIYVQ